MILEMFVEEFLTFVGLYVHGSPVLRHGCECFCDIFPFFMFDRFDSEGKPGEDVYSDHVEA